MQCAQHAVAGEEFQKPGWSLLYMGTVEGGGRARVEFVSTWLATQRASDLLCGQFNARGA